MDATTFQGRNTLRTAMLTAAVIYCLMLTVKIGYWLIGDGWDMARMGDVPLISMLPVALTCILLVVSALSLWRRSVKSSWFLSGSLLFGLALIPLMMPEVLRVPVIHYGQLAWYALPSALQAALLVAIWVYSLKMRRTGYFT